MSADQAQAVTEVTPAPHALGAIRTALNATFKERKDAIDCVLVALLSQKNAFLLGPPGTGKSAMVNALCSAIGGKYFYIMMGKTTSPEELFGQYSIQALREGRNQRDTAGMLPEAHIACLDEVFKASSAVLNNTLTLMNERTFRNGRDLLKTPLQTVIGASNEIPESEELGALYDRFTLKVKVDYIQQDAEAAAIMFGTDVESAEIPKITLEQLTLAQEAALKLPVPKDIRQALLELRRLIKQEGLQVSDRKWRQAVEVIQAFAHLNGHAEVQEDDLEILEHVLWEKPDQFKTVKRLVSKVSNPVGEQVQKIMDAVQEVFEDIKSQKIQPADAANKIKGAIRQLEKLGKPEQNPKLKAALDSVRKIQQQILKEFLGLE